VCLYIAQPTTLTEYNLKTKTSYEAAFLVICFNGCEYFVNYISILNKNNVIEYKYNIYKLVNTKISWCRKSTFSYFTFISQ